VSYIVVFSGPGGDEEVVLCPTIDAATSLAEDLRNRRAIADVRLGRVEPIAFTFAPQYRVNIDEKRPEPVTAPPTALVDRPPTTRSEPVASRSEPAPVEPAPVEPAPVEPAADPRRVRPGELTPAEIAEMVAIDEAVAPLSADDPMVQDALASRGNAGPRQNGLFGR